MHTLPNYAGRMAYLAGHSSAALNTAEAALQRAGFDVVTPTLVGLDDPDAYVAAADFDLSELVAVDVVVTLPNSAEMWEIGVADALGVPIVRFADLMV